MAAITQYDKKDNAPILPVDACPGSLRALMYQDTIKIGPKQYVTICYNCELEVKVDVLLTTIAGVLTPIPRIAIHGDMHV